MLSIELTQGNQLIHIIMKGIQFILSILVTLCAACMLYGAITNYSPMKLVSITIMSIIFIMCAAFVWIAYKELKCE